MNKRLFSPAALCALALGLGALTSGCATGSTTIYTPQTEVKVDVDVWVQMDRIAKRYAKYDYRAWDSEPSQELAEAFAPIRESEGWRAFVRALQVCDSTVNQLMDENILDWSKAGQKIEQVNQTRNAWRRASTFGILPPELPLGWTEFAEDGISFHLDVRGASFGGSSTAVLVARSARGQVIGFFDLELWREGRNHLTNHMLASVIRYPDAYLNYPWNILMAADTIYVDDITVVLDRVNSKVVVGERHAEKKTVESK